MPRHPKSSPFSDFNIRLLAGSAIYTEAAISAGKEWDPTKLEELTCYRKSKGNTNTYRLMYAGTVPEDTTCILIDQSLKQPSQNRLATCCTLTWRNHPYWGLLYKGFSNHEYIEQALRSIDSNIKRYIWTYPADDTTNNAYIARYDTDIDLIESVAEHRNFHALITLTAWAREANDQKRVKPQWHCATHSREIFAHTVCFNPHLHIRWPLLVEIYKDLIWTCPEYARHELWFDMEWEKLLDEIRHEEKIARTKGTPLLPIDLFEKINKVHLARIYQ